MKRLCTATITVIFFVCLATQIILAHSCSFEELGGTKIQFVYDDGTKMAGAKIIVNGANDEKLDTGMTDKDGTYDYADYADAAVAIVANDGEGHLCTYTVPDVLPDDVEGATPSDTSDSQNNLPFIITLAVIGIGAIIVVSRIVKRKDKVTS